MEKNNLIKKFLSFSVGGYINIIIGFFIIPITTRMLSPEQYGIYSIMIMISQISMILSSLAMEQSFVRFFFEEEEETRGKLLYTTLVPFFIIGSVLFSVIFIFRKKISIFIIGKNENIIWLYLIFSILFMTINLFSFLVIRMKQRGKIYSLLTVLIKSLEFIFIFIFYVYFGNNYKTLILAFLFSNIVVAFLSVLIEKKMWSLKNLKLKCKTSKKELLYFSMPLVLTMGLNWLFGSLDKITIKMFKDLGEVGIYSSAFKVVSLLNVIQSGFTNFWTPTALEYYKKNPNDTEFYKKANDYLSLIFFILGINVLIFRNMVGIVLGKEFYASIYVMPTLVFIPIMYLISETTMLGIGFKKKSQYFLYVSVIASVSNLIGNLLLVPHLGARGAAISTGISYIIFFSSRTYFSNKLINFGFNLKRIYVVTFLILFYAIYLTFYDTLIFTIILGLMLEVIVIILYFPILKDMYLTFFSKNNRGE